MLLEVLVGVSFLILAGVILLLVRGELHEQDLELLRSAPPRSGITALRPAANPPRRRRGNG